MWETTKLGSRLFRTKFIALAIRYAKAKKKHWLWLDEEGYWHAVDGKGKEMHKWLPRLAKEWRSV